MKSTPFTLWPHDAQQRFINEVRQPININEMRELLDDAHRELEEQTRLTQYNRRIAEQRLAVLESLPSYRWRRVALGSMVTNVAIIAVLVITAILTWGR